MEKIKEFWQNYFKEILTTIFVFLMFLILFRVAPMMYDGWISQPIYLSRAGLIDFGRYVVKDAYNYINGRIMSNFICGIIESFSSEWVLDIFNALVLVGIFIVLYNILQIKNKKNNYRKCILLYMSLIFLISSRMRNEVLFYANTAYIFPVLLILIYYYIYTKFFNKNIDNKIKILMTFIVFTISTWMEHISLAFTFILFGLFLFNYIKKNKNKLFYFGQFIISILGNMIMFFSPALRASRTIVAPTGIFSTIFTNINNFYVDIISENIIYIFLFGLFTILILIKNMKKNKPLKIITLISAIFLVLSSGLKILSNYFPFKILNFTNYIYSSNVNDCNLIIVFLILIAILFCIISLIIISKNKLVYIYLISIALLSLAPMCFTPNTGARISMIGAFILILIICIQFLEIKKVGQNINLINVILLILFIISLDNTVLLERRLNEVNIKRERIIADVIEKQELGEWDYEKYVFLPVYNSGDFLNNGGSYMDLFYYPHFLKAEKLNPNTKVYFSNVDAFTQTKIQDNIIRIKVISNTNVQYKYKYFIYYSLESYENAYVINSSDFIEKDNYEYNINNPKGFYHILVYRLENNGEEVLIGNDYLQLTGE